MKFVKSSVVSVILLSLSLHLPVQAETTSFKQLVDTYKINRNSDPFSLKSRNRNFKIGVKWGFSGTCGDMDMDLSIQNNIGSAQLKAMWNNWLSQAKLAFSPANLLALAFKRANPDLYDIMQNGIIQATASFDEDMDVCNTIQSTLLDQVPTGVIDGLAVNKEFTATIKNAYAGASIDIGDVTDFVKDAGQRGFDFLGQTVGGNGQPDAEVIDGIAKAGYNIAREKVIAGTTTIDLLNTTTTPVSDYADYPFAEEFSNPQDLADFLKGVIGEIKLASRDGTNSIEHEKGAGAKIYIHELALDIAAELSGLILNGANPNPVLVKSFLDTFNENKYGAYITGTMLEELVKMSPSDESSYVQALAGEWALNGTIRRLVIAKKILLIGSNEASIVEARSIQRMALDKIKLIEDEINEIELEYRIKKEFTNTATDFLFSRSLRNSQEGMSYTNKSGSKK